MRIASFVFLGLVLALLANLAVSAAYPPYREFVRGFRTNLIPGYSTVKLEGTLPSKETQVTTDQTLVESLSRVNAGLDALIASTATGSEQISGSGTVTGSGVTGSGVIEKDVSWKVLQSKNGNLSEVKVTPQDLGIPISGILLAKLMPDIMPHKVENRGIFDIHIFSSIAYTTYQDDKTKIRFYTFGETYSVMLSNLKLVSWVYTVNETDTFFDSTFFLNTTSKKDSTIRFVTELEGKAIGVEVPKNLYSKLKKLLLKK